MFERNNDANNNVPVDSRTTRLNQNPPINQAAPTYIGPSAPDLNTFMAQVTDGEIWNWMHYHSQWHEFSKHDARFVYIGLKDVYNGWQGSPETQYALTDPVYKNEARQAIAQQRYQAVLTWYNQGQQLQKANQDNLNQFINLVNQRESQRDAECNSLQIRIQQLELELKKLQGEAAAKELTDKIKKLIIDSQLTPSSANNFLLQATELNAFDAVKLALDNGADKDTCDKALKLTNSPKIKIMLFAARERGQKPDNTERQERAIPNKNFDLKNDKLVSHWPLEGSAIDENHINTGKQHDVGVVDNRQNPVPFFHFDGNAFIKGDAYNLPKGNKTISLMFKADEDTNGQIAGGTLFSYCDEDASLAFVLNHDIQGRAKSGNIYAYVFGKPGKKIEYSANSDDHFDNWNHFVLSTDNNNGTSIYINGKCVARTNTCLNLKKPINTFAIGAFVYDKQLIDNPIDLMFKGCIKDVMIYSEGLTREEVCALYEVQSLKREAGVVDVNQVMGWLQEKEPSVYKKLLESKFALFQGSTAQRDYKGQDSKHTAENDSSSEFTL